MARMNPSKDFAELVRGLRPVPFGPLNDVPAAGESAVTGARRRASGASPVVDTHGTTVIAVKYRDGVLNVGDRRATAAMAVRCDPAAEGRPWGEHTPDRPPGPFPGAAGGRAD